MSDSFLQSYDLAIKYVLYNKFAAILGIDTQTSSEEENINLSVLQYPKEVAQRVAAEKRGETFLEFINFWKMGASFSWARNRTPLSRRGMWLNNAADGLDSIHVKAVPIDLSYNAWFWSQDLDKVYQVIEDYVFWQQNNPNISLLYTDLDSNTYELTPDLHFGEIVDESTVMEQYSRGIIYVYKMPIKLDAWVLKGLSFKTIQKIVFTLRDKDEVTNYEEIIIEDSNQDTELEAILRFSKEEIYGIHEITLPNTIVILGSYTDEFIADKKIQIVDSTGNDGMYTVVSSSLAEEKTSIVVSETLADSTADGVISFKNIY